MIQLHVDILQNLQQVTLVVSIPSSADCGIQTDQVVVEDEEEKWKTVIHFNDLIIDVNKGAEVALSNLNLNVSEEGQTRRTFKFPFLRLPKVLDDTRHALSNTECAKCQSVMPIIAQNQTFKIIQQENANADDINEVIYCHRFCESHQHEHEHQHQQSLHTPPDLHSELMVLETTDCFMIAKEYLSSNLINNELVQCNHCCTHLGILDAKTKIVSLDKCALFPFSTDYLSSCFRQYEPGRYIVKAPKFNESIFLVWILPNQILSASTSISSTVPTTSLEFHRMKKLLYTHVTSAENEIFSEWKRDFSVTTLLVSRLCLEHLSIAFKQELAKFPNVFNSNEAFQSLTISL